MNPVDAELPKGSAISDIKFKIEDGTTSCLSKVRPVIGEGTKSLVEAGLSCGYFNEENDPLGPHHTQDCNLAALCDMAKELPLVSGTENETEQNQVIDIEDGCMAQLDLFTRITENCMDCAVEVTLMGEKYIIPPRCSFLLSDFTRMQPLVNCKRRYGLIVLDPPWENKSAKRSGRYSFLPSTQLRRLPVPLLAAPGGLVVTWVTNRPSHLRFVREELYPHWGVEVLAEWLWVKVTRSGEFVFPLDSLHKKPYEVLVLGRYRGSSTESTSLSEKSETTVEDHRVIVSVPSVLHSQKPSLSEVLKPFVGVDAGCLELFARSLQPGWTSWGNEVLKFQHVSYFNIEPTGEPIETPAEKHTEEPKENPAEKHTEEPKENPAEKHTEEPKENPAEKRTEEPKENPAEKHTEEPKENPAEKRTEEPKENPAEKHTDNSNVDTLLHKHTDPLT